MRCTTAQVCKVRNESVGRVLVSGVIDLADQNEQNKQPEKGFIMDDDTARAYAKTFIERNTFDPKYYEKYDVKRGLRNSDGTGVVAGITDISNVHGYIFDEGDKIPIEGKLTFRGYDIRDLIEHFV